jgi:hypothetical protein
LNSTRDFSNALLCHLLDGAGYVLTVEYCRPLVDTRELLPQAQWEKGAMMLTGALLMALIAPRRFSEEATKQAFVIGWTLPTKIMHASTKTAEILATLRHDAGFVFDGQPAPDLRVIVTKAEAAKFIKLKPSTRRATNAEIEDFLMNRAFTVYPIGV